MAVFSPKAKELIGAAIADVSQPEYRHVWWSWVQSHPDVRSPGEPWQNATAGLPVEVIIAALWALEEMARRLRMKREWGTLSEDEASDVDNYLSRIKSVQKFLVQGSPSS
jgi:hypothetical protein